MGVSGGSVRAATGGKYPPQRSTRRPERVVIRHRYCFHVIRAGIPPSSGGIPEGIVNAPDLKKVRYVLEGIKFGFSTGFEPDRVYLKTARSNMKSAVDHPDIIDAYIANEVALGRMAGPFVVPPYHNVQCSPFGVVPKKRQAGKWRLILDLSSPEGHSVNDGISREQFSLKYVSVETAIAILMEVGPGALMAKFDIECAYRNIPIIPQERYLLGMSWRDQFYVDLALPFDLRSAPYIFNSVAEVVEWILQNNYSIKFILHYLDDFLTIAPGDTSECANNVTAARLVFSRLGLPLHPTKCEGPTTLLVFLGIELDSVSQTARLPQEKLAETRRLLNKWAGKRWCSRTELESLIGTLHHVCKVVPLGRSFLRRMINLLCASE